MKPRSVALLGSAVLFSQLVYSQSPPDIPNTSDVPQDCTFEGNADFYGIGVRLGFYFQWFSGLIAFVINPEDSDAQADAQTIFLLANLIALIILQVQSQNDPVRVVVPILLFYMFFGGSVSAITSATTSLSGWKTANKTKRIALVARQMFVQFTFLATLVYSFYFWTEGFKKFDRSNECGGTFVFPVPHRVKLDSPSTGSVLALLFLVLFVLLIWLVAFKRLRRSFPTHIPVAASKLAFNHGDDTPLPPWEGRQL